MRIEFLADHPELLSTLAEWHHAEWGFLHPGSNLGDRAEMIRTELQRGTLPFALVAIEDDQLVGSASVVHHDMDRHLEWTPWLASVFVHAAHRRRGVGSALVQRAVAEARSLGHYELYLFTFDQARFYARLGWRELLREEYRGVNVTIMTIRLGAGSGPLPPDPSASLRSARDDK